MKVPEVLDLQHAWTGEELDPGQRAAVRAAFMPLPTMSA